MYIDFDKGDLTDREEQIVDGLMMLFSLVVTTLGSKRDGTPSTTVFEGVVKLMNQRIPGLNFRLAERPPAPRRGTVAAPPETLPDDGATR